MDKRLIAAIATAALVACLTGCDPINDFDAEVAVSSVDGQLQLVSCETRQTDRVLLEWRDFSVSGSEWQTLLDMDGAGILSAATPVGVSAVPTGLQVRDSLAFVPEPGAIVSIYLGGVGQNAALTTKIAVPSTGFVDGQWVTPQGDWRDAPCVLG